MRNEQENMLRTLREIEQHARALSDELPLGVPRHRARQIAILAAHVALTLQIEGKTHRGEAANDNGRDQHASQA